MGDLIDRQAAIEALDKRFDSIPMEQTSEILMLRKDLRELPHAQPEPSQVAKDISRILENGQDMMVIGQERIRGRWIPVGGALYKCDQCGVVSLKRKFCSECGADMREVTE